MAAWHQNGHYVLDCWEGWMSDDPLEDAIKQCHRDLATLLNGDASAWRETFSQRGDVTLGNPFGPFVRGIDDVMSTAQAAADRYRDGEIVDFERVGTYVSEELACIAEVERFRARVGGSDSVANIALRVTSAFRREDGVWRLVHRHADPITTPQTDESVVQR
jgi:ketosteroid isomerase-like protein